MQTMTCNNPNCKQNIPFGVTFCPFCEEQVPVKPTPKQAYEFSSRSDTLPPKGQSVAHDDKYLTQSSPTGQARQIQEEDWGGFIVPSEGTIIEQNTIIPIVNDSLYTPDKEQETSSATNNEALVPAVVQPKETRKDRKARLKAEKERAKEKKDRAVPVDHYEPTPIDNEDLPPSVQATVIKIVVWLVVITVFVLAAVYFMA